MKTIIFCLLISIASFSQGKSGRKHFNAVVNVKTFGATGDGVTDDLAAVQRAFNSIDTGTIFFPRGVYIIANNKNNLQVNCRKIHLLGEDGSILTDLQGAGGSTGENIAFNNCQKVEIDYLTFKEVYLKRPNSFNNFLGFNSCKNVHINHCIFGEISNKHIHFERGGSNIIIENSEFYRSCYNSNPLSTPSGFGSIFFYYQGAKTPRVKKVTIRNNYFHDNYLFCISANNFEAASDSGMFTAFLISSNKFKNNTGGILFRGKGKIFKNEFQNIGLRNILKAYDFQSALGRYYSKTRSQNDTTPPNKSNTLVPIATGVIGLEEASDLKVIGNVFSGSAAVQSVLVGQPKPISLYITGNNNKKIVIDNNIMDDQYSDSLTIRPLWIKGKLGQSRVTNNTVLLPAKVKLFPLFRIDSISENVFSGNKVSSLEQNKQINSIENLFTSYDIDCNQIKGAGEILCTKNSKNLPTQSAGLLTSQIISMNRLVQTFQSKDGEKYSRTKTSDKFSRWTRINN